MKHSTPPAILLIVGLAVFVFSGISRSAETVHFSGMGETVPPDSCVFAGKANIAQETAVDLEDEVGVFASDGNGGEMLVGACVMGDVVAGHYFMHVYADDPTTEKKDGAYDKETLVFKVWDKSENKEHIVPPASPYMIFESDADLLRPDIPPVWTNGTVLGFGLLNLSPPVFPGDLDGNGRVALRDAVLAMRIAVQAGTGTPIYKAADIGGDGKIGLEEAVYALQLVANLRDPIR